MYSFTRKGEKEDHIFFFLEEKFSVTLYTLFDLFKHEIFLVELYIFQSKFHS